MPQAPQPDSYAKGMVAYGDAEAEATPTYDRWQFGLFRRFLGSKILEVGAGSGRITGLVIDYGQFDELIATEPSPHFFKLLRRRTAPNSKVKLLQSTTRDLSPTYGSHFDSVFSVHVLEHIDNDVDALREQLDLVRPGGNLIVLVPAMQFLFSDLDRNIGHFRRYNKAMFRALVQKVENCKLEKMFYSNALGVLGSFYFSKVRRINYQGSEQNRRNFFRLYRWFSEYVVPWIDLIESRSPVPFGLNLTVVLRKL